MNAGVPMTMLGSANAELAKALSIPVPGAVVVAPLTQSWTNYGSLGSEFTKVGSPTVGDTGAVFNGSTAAYLTTGNSFEFTLVARIRVTSFPANYRSPISVMQSSASSIGWAYVFNTAQPNFSVASLGQQPVYGSVARDTNPHVITLRRDSAINTVKMYIDGVEDATAAAGVSTGTILSLGIYMPTNSGSNAPCVIANVAQFNSKLSDANRALVEAWAAT